MKRLPLLIPPDLRFTCERCGLCCRAFTVGLEDNVAAREVSLFFRGRCKKRLRERTGGFAPLCNSRIAC